jgi:hypothetical protein
MAKLTPEEEKKKRDLFEAMSPRSQKRILKKGYEEWDLTLDSGHELHERYFSEHRIPDYSPEYVKGVLEIAQGLFRGQDRYQGMYDFSCWYEKWRKQPEDED